MGGAEQLLVDAAAAQGRDLVLLHRVDLAGSRGLCEQQCLSVPVHLGGLGGSGGALAVHLSTHALAVDDAPSTFLLQLGLRSHAMMRGKTVMGLSPLMSG
jgi:hypothetical protein